MLDAPHFHVVFTLPAELRPIAAFERERVFALLFATAWTTLAAFAKTRLTGSVGALLVLHTWTRKLEFDPHVHAIVTAGALSFDGHVWRPSERAFLFPVKAISRVFRAKMLAALRHAYRDGDFDGFEGFDDPESFSRLGRALANLSWHVYAKPTFTRGAHVAAGTAARIHRPRRDHVPSLRRPPRAARRPQCACPAGVRVSSIHFLVAPEAALRAFVLSALDFGLRFRARTRTPSSLQRSRMREGHRCPRTTRPVSPYRPCLQDAKSP
jgi:hypothetical protein